MVKRVLFRPTALAAALLLLLCLLAVAPSAPVTEAAAAAVDEADAGEMMEALKEAVEVRCVRVGCLHGWGWGGGSVIPLCCAVL